MPLTLSAVAYNLTGAVAATGVGEASLKSTEFRGELVAHYVGTKMVFRALDLDEWVARLPEARGTAMGKARPGAPSIALPALSYDMDGAAAACGISKSTLTKAIADGELVVHYFGEKASRRVVRAVDLDEYVASLPTESSRPRPRSIYDF